MTSSERHHGEPLPMVTHRDWKRADILGLSEPLKGRRATLVNRDGSHHDYRAWSDLQPGVSGVVLYVVTDADWWEYVLTRIEPDRPLRWPAQAVWIEEGPGRN